MNGDVAPLADAWVAAVHAAEDDYAPLGTAAVIDERRLLTCAHVVTGSDGVRPGLWVAFPKAENAFGPRRAVRAVRVAGPRLADLAVLELDGPLPAGVAAARVRCPRPADVVGRAWWAFGFAGGDPLGNSADGVVGASLAYGWVRLDTGSRYLVEPGFSGGGLWSPDYAAVIGVVGAANDRGDGQAILLHQADSCLPEEKIRLLAEWSVAAAGDVALAAWGWTLAEDPEAGRHWRPRARGVSVESERGYRFRGRRTVLSEIVSWLDRQRPDRKVLVVTGSPGVGKSAVLGRIVTTADADVAAGLPADDDAIRATLGSVACAVHAKGKTALDVAMEIARAASAPIPERLDDLAPGLRAALADRGGRRFNVVVDALDEASSPAEARSIITRVVLPIAETCDDVDAQLVVGTRRHDDAGDVLRLFGPARTEIDLDAARYFAVEDLAAYALATLQLRGEERPGNPYTDETVALPVAERIASLADQNFLVAGLIARSHGLHDRVAADPDRITLTATVDAALTTYLDRVPAVDGTPATDILLGLAFAEAPGLTVELWQVAVPALTGRGVPPVQLARFARGSAANFLVESSQGSAEPTYRLFHQALSDVLIGLRGQSVPAVSDQRALTRGFLAYGVRVGWDAAPAYLFRSLPGHAVRAGLIDELLADEDYLLHADLRRLIPAAAAATTQSGRQHARLLRLTPGAVTAGAQERAALFSVTEALEGVSATYGELDLLPYRGRWARVAPHSEHAILEGHTGGVWAVCPVQVNGRSLLASAGDDGRVRIWDPASGQEQRRLHGHTGRVNAVCPMQVDGRSLLASAGADGTVRIWDPASGQEQRRLHGHTGRVNAVCPMQVDGRSLLASAGADGTVRIWDPASGQEQRRLHGHSGRVDAVCPMQVDGRSLLASAGADDTVRIWDPASGQEQRRLQGHSGRVDAVCPIQVDGRSLLASAGADDTVRIWDPASGQEQRRLQGHSGRVDAVCPIQVDGRSLLASAGEDDTVRIWDPASGQEQRRLEGHTDWVRAVCPVQVSGRSLLASAGDDGTVRIWDPAGGAERRRLEGHTGGVNAVCPVQVSGRSLLASAGSDGTVRIWDPASGQEQRRLEGHTGAVRALCPVQVSGRSLLASAGADGTVRIWDPASGQEQRRLEGHSGRVNAVCPVQVDGRSLLASAGDDGTVRIWDPASGQEQRRLEGHTGRVTAVCPVQVDGRSLLGSAGSDRTVRIWDPASGQEQRRLEGHTDWVRAVCPVQVDGRSLLGSAGSDRTVRIWDPASGQEQRRLEGHTGGVRALCPVQVASRSLLASAGSDRTVRIWNAGKAEPSLRIPVHHPALALAPFPHGMLTVGLSAGLLALTIDS
jgi:WD40 repeat protein